MTSSARSPHHEVPAVGEALLKALATRSARSALERSETSDSVVGRGVVVLGTTAPPSRVCPCAAPALTDQIALCPPLKSVLLGLPSRGRAPVATGLWLTTQNTVRVRAIGWENG